MGSKILIRLAAGIFVAIFVVWLFRGAIRRNTVMIHLVKQSQTTLSRADGEIFRSLGVILDVTNDSTLHNILGTLALINGDVNGATYFAHLSPDHVVEDPASLIRYYSPFIQRFGIHVRDQITGQILSRREESLLDNDRETASQLLVMASELRPFDLYVLLESTIRSTNVQTGGNRNSEFDEFPLDAVTSTSPQMRYWIAEAVVALAINGYWTTEQLERISRLWLWKYPFSSDTQLLLMKARDAFPKDTTWPYQLGLLFEAQDDQLTAIKQYTDALSIDSSNLASQSRVLRLKSRTPNQLQTNDQFESFDSLVSILLDIPLSQFILGPELIATGRMSAWLGSQPVEWSWSDMSGGEYFGDGLFVGGQDFLTDGRTSARIDGLWREDIPGGHGARAGFWSNPFSMPPNTTWAIAVTYMTSRDCDSRSASILLEPETPQLFSESFLPTTSEQWRTEAIVIMNDGDNPINIRPLIRNWAACSVWVDAISMHQVTYLAGTSLSSLPTFIASWPLAPVQ